MSLWLWGLVGRLGVVGGWMAGWGVVEENKHCWTVGLSTEQLKSLQIHKTRRLAHSAQPAVT